MGVYGLRVLGLLLPPEDGHPLLLGSPELTVTQQIGLMPAGTRSMLTDDRAVIPLVEGGLVEMERASGHAVFTAPRPIPDREILHPWLVPAAATISAWHGRRGLHGGAVTDGVHAIALVGAREAGKSTLLAWLALHTSLRVMADDLVVIEGKQIFGGPACIDLRAAALPVLGPGLRVSEVRGDGHLRLTLPATEPFAQLAGVVVLEWGAVTRLEPVAASQRLTEVLPHAMTEGLALGLGGVLEYARHPVWRLSRARHPSSLAPAAELIAGLLHEASRSGAGPL